MTFPFTEELHPRGRAGNAGQFRTKIQQEPGAALGLSSPQADAAVEHRREVIREMVRIAPAGSRKVIFELYGEGDPETELFTFQHAADADGEVIEMSPELTARYWQLCPSDDFENAEEDGFHRDGEMFWLDIPETDTALTADELEAAIFTLRLSLVTKSSVTREEADRCVHAAAAQHIRALAARLTPAVRTLVLDWGEGSGLHLVRTEGPGGEVIHDPGAGNVQHAANDTLLDEISFAATNIRQPSLADAAAASGGDGPFTLTLTLNP